MRKRVAIIGAGASGLPAIRHALLYEFEPVCFEMSAAIGGLWRYKPEETDESSVMKSTVINTSKEMTAYSDFPPPAEFANFMHNSQLLAYFELYAKEYDLKKYIRFEHKVLKVERSDDFEEKGTWNVIYAVESGQEHTERFDALLIASGHHTTPHFPQKWPGQNDFKGRILHAHSYKDYRGFEDKEVVVVGVGNSGGDIAVELSRIAKQVQLVTRRGTWVFNRVYDNGQPYDVALGSRLSQTLRSLLPLWFINDQFEKILNRRFDHAAYGLKPKHRVASAHPTINDELPTRIACGKIVVRPNIESFTKNGVVFKDGICISDVDAVILATGYSFEFPFVENGDLLKVRDNNVELYKYMFPLDTAQYNTLAVLGLIQPIGSIMPIAELQARLFYDTLARTTVLPNRENMKMDIEKKRTEMAMRYVASPRHTIQVDAGVYMDELASLMNCTPNLLKLFFTDYSLWRACLNGPLVSYQYRLNGPHTWAGAREALLAVEERILAPMRTRKVD